jgi:hypothetical protein
MTKAKLVRLALIGALAVWCSGTVFSLVYGKSLPQAVSSGGASALGGLILCAVYYLISPRDDGIGLMFLGMNLGPVTSPTPVSFWSGALRDPLLVLPFVLLLHVISRREKVKADNPRSADRMYDEDTDRRAGPPVAG